MTRESDLDPSEWAAVLSAMEEVIDLAPDEQSLRLGAALNQDTRLLECARSLLRGQGSNEPADLGRAGPYQLQRLIGRGGMGALYLGSRADGSLHRRVAIKLVPPGLGTEKVIARFKQERQVQANLVHPGIATLLDGGETDAGLPYLVLEYVEGTAVDEWCDEQRLGVLGRIALFEKIAKAVGHAHSNHVLHRDIKPSNVLVNRDGEPKLLDFGIAKVLDPVGRATVTLTGEGVAPMTPAYASPEQFLGGELSSASDIYSLGVLLFQLVTGRLPLDLKGCTPAQMEQVVTADPPTLPVRAAHAGGAVVAKARGTTPQELRRLVNGDLAKILMMCLRKEPERRYPTTDALVEDLERYREGRPILARPDTVAYRVQRFVSRNRMAVGVTAAVITALTAALLVSMGQYRRAASAGAAALRSEEIATARLQNLREFRFAILNDVVPAIAEIPGALHASESLVAVNLACLDREDDYPQTDPMSVHERIRCYLLLGAHQGRPSAANRGDTDGALKTHLKALELAESLLAEYPTNKNAAYLVAQCLLSISEIRLVLGQDADGLRALGRAKFVGEQALRGGGNVHRVQEKLYDVLIEISREMWAIHRRQGRLAAAMDAAESGLAHVDGKTTEFPDTAYFMEGDRCDLQGLVAELNVGLGAYGEALALLTPAVERLKSMLSGHEPNGQGVAMQARLAVTTSKAYAGLH